MRKQNEINSTSIDVEKIVRHWIESSDNDFNVMLTLYRSKTYSWALFIGHIAVEKLLKAYYVKAQKTHAPFTHNLYRLAELSALELTDEYADWLYTITTFNISARYDDYKKEFYTLCTADYTKEWIDKIEQLHSWIKERL
ncbi:MAG: HEPN domain-containing protein [Prevotellaceae bacterium]|nr:HEPN domain-containing protein [Prevotellaceae bacterium]